MQKVKSARMKWARHDLYDKEIPLLKKYFENAMYAGTKLKEFSLLNEDASSTDQDSMYELIEAIKGLLDETISVKISFSDDKINLDKNLTKSKKRLIKCFDQMTQTLEYCISKAGELLNYI